MAKDDKKIEAGGVLKAKVVAKKKDEAAPKGQGPVARDQPRLKPARRRRCAAEAIAGARAEKPATS